LQLQQANHELVGRLHSDAQDRIAKLQESAALVLMHDSEQTNCAREGHEQVQQLLAQLDEAASLESNTRNYHSQMKKSALILEAALAENTTAFKAMEQVRTSMILNSFMIGLWKSNVKRAFE
jgi:hypothetical protein